MAWLSQWLSQVPNVPIDSVPLHQNGSLCWQCEAFDIHSFFKDPFYSRGYSFRSLKLAAAAGCNFCSLVLDAFRERRLPVLKARYRREGNEDDWWVHFTLGIENVPTNEEVPQSMRAVTTLNAKLAPRNLGMPYAKHLTAHSEVFVEHSFHVIADPGTTAYDSGFVRGRYVGEDAASTDHISLLRMWLNSCLGHKRCCITLSQSDHIQSTAAPLPTRCIDVMGPSLRLVDCSGRTGSFVALSHRWTDEVFHCRSTMENLQFRLDGEPGCFDGLPRPMKDVFDVAQKLNIRYVWIDSLCIIQAGDSGQDWTREAVKMGSYYQNAHLTISASSADPLTGLFPNRQDHPPRLAQLPFVDPDGHQQGFFYVTPYRQTLDDHYRNHIQRSELFSRGWVLQEWLLSRRIVYFTPAGMIFECATEGPRNERGEAASTDYGDIWSTERPLAKAAYSFDEDNLHDLWYWVVQWYSGLSLTKAEQDRIVALAGIAKEYRLSLQKQGLFFSTGKSSATLGCGPEYAAGLWLRDLHRGLVWQAAPPSSDSAAITPIRLAGIPTWSWASTTLPVVWHPERDGTYDKFMQPQATILEVQLADGRSLPIEPLSSAGARLVQQPLPGFEEDNKFASIYFRATFLTLLVRDRMTAEEDIVLTREMLGPAHMKNTRLWRKVCVPDNRHEICGWASIEHPDVFDTGAFEDGIGLELHAFVLGTRQGYGAHGLGSLGFTYTIYILIFVARMGPAFERVGIGHVFGPAVDAMYNRADVDEFILV